MAEAMIFCYKGGIFAVESKRRQILHWRFTKAAFSGRDFVKAVINGYQANGAGRCAGAEYKERY